MSQNPHEPPLEYGGADGTAPRGKPPGRATKIRWLVLALACATSFILYLHRYSWGVVKLDVKKEYGFSDTELGWLDSAFAGAYAFGQIPGGLAGDIFGPAIVLPIIILAWSAIVGLTAFGGGFYSLLGLRVGFGATQASAYPNLSKVTRSWFPRSIRTVLQGVVASFAGRMGGAFTPLLIGTVLMGACGLGWRPTLVILAVAGIVFAILFWWLFRNCPAEHPWANDAEQKLIDAEEPPETTAAPVRFTRSPWAWISFSFLLFHLFCSAGADQLYVNWIPYFLQDAKGMSKMQMGVFAMLPLFGGALGGMFGGVLNDLLIRATGRRRLSRSIVGCSGKVIAAALVVLALTIADGRIMMVVVGLAKFFTDWSQPTVWGTVTDVGGRASGRVFGAVNMCGSLGSMALNPVLGSAKEYFGATDTMAGWNAVFIIIIGLYVVAGLVWFGIDATKRLVVEEQESVKANDSTEEE